MTRLKIVIVATSAKQTAAVVDYLSELSKGWKKLFDSAVKSPDISQQVNEVTLKVYLKTTMQESVVEWLLYEKVSEDLKSRLGDGCRGVCISIEQHRRIVQQKGHNLFSEKEITKTWRTII